MPVITLGNASIIQETIVYICTYIDKATLLRSSLKQHPNKFAILRKVYKGKIIAYNK